MIMEENAAVSAPFPRTSPTKRSFDVAFLTGVRDTPPTPEEKVQPPSPSTTNLQLSPSSLSNTPVTQSLTPNVSPVRTQIPSSISSPNPAKLPRVSENSLNSLKERLPSPSSDDSTPTSAFTKVTRASDTLTPQISANSSSLSSASWATTTPTLNAVTSFLSGNKNLAPLLATSGIFNPTLSPLFPPDRINNNFVEEYLKTQQNLMAGKSSIDASSISPSEALSRLRSSMYSNDPYKMPFGSLGYPMTQQPTPTPPKINTTVPPFIPHNPVAAMIPSALNTLNMASQNVCAKCNISFRMTSDLVYHMRSQHKKEQDPYTKRRNDRLKCTICGESFRERHHLTRHMTAHQDRKDEPENK